MFSGDRKGTIKERLQGRKYRRKETKFGEKEAGGGLGVGGEEGLEVEGPSRARPP